VRFPVAYSILVSNLQTKEKDKKKLANIKIPQQHKFHSKHKQTGL